MVGRQAIVRDDHHVHMLTHGGAVISEILSLVYIDGIFHFDLYIVV
jgi:hypothetical protein